jgi:hypothetical protein
VPHSQGKRESGISIFFLENKQGEKIKKVTKKIRDQRLKSPGRRRKSL